MGLIPNDWKHILRTETSQKSLLKTFCYNNKVTRKVKDFKKLSNKEIFTSQSSFYLIVLNTTNLSNLFHDRDVEPFCKLDIKNFTLPSYESP